MITSIFNKSRPINFVIVFFIVLLAFLTARIEQTIDVFTFGFITKQVTIFLLCCITILVLHFIIIKNSLTKKNNYHILLFSLFLLAIVQTTSHTNILLSNFFVLLGLRRIISLRSQINLKKKLFDAAFWVAIAALFYFWAILFFIVIILSLFLYTDNNIKHWIIPFISVFTVLLIVLATSVVLYDDLFGIFKGYPNVGFDFSNYNSSKYLITITMLISFGIWASIFYLQNLKHKKKASRASFKIIIIAALIAFIIVIVVPVKTGSEFLFLFAPLAIIITNYIEIIKEKWFKEIFVAVLILVPFICLML